VVCSWGSPEGKYLLEKRGGSTAQKLLVSQGKSTGSAAIERIVIWGVVKETNRTLTAFDGYLKKLAIEGSRGLAYPGMRPGSKSVSLSEECGHPDFQNRERVTDAETYMLIFGGSSSCISGTNAWHLKRKASSEEISRCDGAVR